MIDSWDWLVIGRAHVWEGPCYHGYIPLSLLCRLWRQMMSSAQDDNIHVQGISVCGQWGKEETCCPSFYREHGLGWYSGKSLGVVHKKKNFKILTERWKTSLNSFQFVWKLCLGRRVRYRLRHEVGRCHLSHTLLEIEMEVFLQT